MKICFNCNEQFTKTTWTCSHCNHTPALIEGHYSFAPELAKESTGFEAKFFARHWFSLILATGICLVVVCSLMKLWTIH